MPVQLTYERRAFYEKATGKLSSKSLDGTNRYHTILFLLRCDSFYIHTLDRINTPDPLKLQHAVELFLRNCRCDCERDSKRSMNLDHPERAVGLHQRHMHPRDQKFLQHRHDPQTRQDMGAPLPADARIQFPVNRIPFRVRTCSGAAVPFVPVFCLHCLPPFHIFDRIDARILPIRVIRHLFSG